jgi:hypothetical protein
MLRSDRRVRIRATLRSAGRRRSGTARFPGKQRFPVSGTEQAVDDRLISRPLAPDGSCAARRRRRSLLSGAAIACAKRHPEREVGEIANV